MPEPARLSRQTCRAPGCARMVEPKYLMCSQHWFQVPRTQRTTIWWEYNNGLRAGTHPTPAYSSAVVEAVQFLQRPVAERGVYLR